MVSFHLANDIARVALRSPLEAAATMHEFVRHFGWERTSTKAHLNAVAQAIQGRFGGTRPSVQAVVEFLATDPSFLRLAHRPYLSLSTWIEQAPRHIPSDGTPADWSVPQITNLAELTSWLGLSLGKLQWLADIRGLEAKVRAESLRNYRYLWVPKKVGPPRLIESPKPMLKQLQRRILDRVLGHIPAHPASCAFQRGSSVRSFVTPHVGQAVVLRLDLQDFFPRLAKARVAAIFRTAGYPEAVAGIFAGLCTNTTPSRVLANQAWAPTTRTAQRSLYGSPHVPQGAPTSPALANLCAFRLDCRLSGLARAADCAYTRYADDLAFSGGPDLARGANRFLELASRIVLEEGFMLNFRKTRVMRQGVAQKLASVVVNERPNLDRRDYDQLKAILQEAVTRGPAIANRSGHSSWREHLQGKISWAAHLNPLRGAKLQAMFDRISW